MSDFSWSACAFDLDGTLLDSHRGIVWAAEAAVAEVLPCHRLVGFGDAIGARVPALFARCLPDARPEQILEVGLAFRRYYDEEGWRRSELFPSIRETLSELTNQSVSCHVVTNKPEHSTRNILQFHGIWNHLTRVISPDTGVGYADKSGALASLVSDLPVEAAAVVYVGDTVEDYQAAKCSGTGFVGAAYGYGRAGFLAHDGIILCPSPDDLLECLRAPLHNPG